MRTIRGVLLCAFAALVVAGAAQGRVEVGITEDTGKGDGGASFFATLNDLGMKLNRVSVNWDVRQPLAVPAQADIASWLPQAQAAGTRIVFAIAPQSARDLTNSPSAPASFADFVRKVAQTFPTVKDYVIGNEPNQPRFWLPQYGSHSKPLAAAAYLPVLAQSYDALKAVDPTITVIGVGLSPRGNDSPKASSNVSRSPVRFLRDLGAAYRASGRKKPLMDELAFHPYPSSNNDSPAVGYVWPNAGMPNLDRIKQAVWDAFHGTAQPTFAEQGATFARPLMLDLDEVGWQVAIPPELAGLYHGVESSKPVDEATQAQYYGDVINRAACDSSVRLLSFFHLTDELDLDRWQSGLLRADGSRRPSYDAVKQTLTRTQGNCVGNVVKWKHATTVVGPTVAWGNLRKRIRATRTIWSFQAGAGEEAAFSAAIFKAGPRKSVIARRLVTGRPVPVLRVNGTIKAKKRVVYLPARRIRPGKYVYAIRMTATMNPSRASVFVSPPFRVRTARR